MFLFLIGCQVAVDLEGGARLVVRGTEMIPGVQAIVISMVCLVCSHFRSYR